MLVLPLELPSGGASVGAADTVMAPPPSFVSRISQENHASRDTLHDQRIRVLLVDDHAMVRQGLRSVLDGYADIEVIGEASDGEEAVGMTERLRPSLVLMDVNMPRMSGIEATVRIKARQPDVVIIGLSVQAGHESHLAMLKAGATRLLTKEAAVDELHHVILHALNRSTAVMRQ
jgi:DNA-binding NarL/FixJ family response regulator